MPSYTIEYFNSFRLKSITPCTIDFTKYSAFEKQTGKHMWAECNPLEKSIINILNKIANVYNKDVCIEMVRLIKFLHTLKNNDITVYACMCMLSRALIDDKFLDSYATLCKEMNYSTGIIKGCQYLFYKHLQTERLTNFCIFAGKLYNNQVFSKNIINYIMDTLFSLEKYTEMCSLLMALKHVNDFETHINTLRNLKNVPNKIRFKILDLLDSL